MLGGFNIVKHENHHYKYAHCTDVNDLKTINIHYGDDLTSDGTWNFDISNLKKGNYVFKSNSKLKRFAENVSFSALLDGGRDWPNAMCHGSGLMELHKNMNFYNMTHGVCFLAWTKLTEVKHDLGLINAINLRAAFEGTKIKSFTSVLPKLQEANELFNSVSTLEEFNSELPSVKYCRNAFNGCKLNKESSLRILNSIPAYTSDEHLLTIGINIDNFYDKEILEAITNAQNKGWTVTTQWNGKITKDEVINSEKIAKLELDSITLPYGYKRCEYLESDTNNQYIDTEIIPTNTTGTWIIAKRITDTITGFHLAVRTDSNYYYPPMLRSNSNYHGWGTTTEWTEFTKQNTAFESYINYPINGTITKEAVAIDNAGTSVAKALTTDLPTISHSLYMFGRNYNGSLEYPWIGRIYRAKISEGDQTIRDFIPALDPDSKPCMYEMIEGKPYYNADTSGNDFLYKVYEDYIMPES